MVGIPYLLLASTGAPRSVRVPGFRLFGLALILFGTMIYAWSASTCIFYEEPVLRRRFGKSYEAYCAAVSRWFPRLPRLRDKTMRRLQ